MSASGPSPALPGTAAAAAAAQPASPPAPPPPPLHLHRRYHIETRDAPDRQPWPSRFEVRVGKLGLLRLLLRELLHYRDPAVVASRPCVYGVFSGPLGGFAPRAERCVGCLRCTVQHPEFVVVRPNPARRRLGDSYFHWRHVETVAYEAATGRIPVRGAGYRGPFGGEGWDAVWTDMSEIVRPTRDGIHGREYISTIVDLGGGPTHLRFDEAGRLRGEIPHRVSVPLPILFDAPPPALSDPTLARVLLGAAAALGTFAILPPDRLCPDTPAAAAPLLHPGADPEAVPGAPPRLAFLQQPVPAAWESLRAAWPGTVIGVRLPFPTDEVALGRIGELYAAGVRLFHFTADYHGRTSDGGFVFPAIRRVHGFFVGRGTRDAVTLLGSGGIVAAEHVPKAIVAGLDAVALDTPLWVALQGRFQGDFRRPEERTFRLPGTLEAAWGRQRLLNLMAAWRDQLLEVLGAMGLREVRRLRGEMGRAMLQAELEREAFGGIEGYDA